MPITENQNQQSENHKFTVDTVESSVRIDAFLSLKLPHATRARIQKLIKDSLVLVDNKKIKASYKVKENQTVTISIPQAPPSTVSPENIPLDILFEDDSVIVINKPAGLVVHPGAGNREGTLVSALLYHCDSLSSIGGELRPGIVHRLDKDTTGVMVCAKTDLAHISLAEQFKEHSTKRTYNAICFGVPKESSGTISLPIGRDTNDRKKISPKSRYLKKAITNYKLLENFEYFSLIEARPETGRTHQIRVHLKSINHHVVGDPVYCKRSLPVKVEKKTADFIKQIKRQLLHARYLGFTHPITKEFLEFTAPLPEDMEKLLELLRNK